MKFGKVQWFALSIAIFAILFYFARGSFALVMFLFGVLMGMWYMELMVKEEGAKK